MNDKQRRAMFAKNYQKTQPIKSMKPCRELMSKEILEIINLGNGIYDFEKIPQGYIKLCGGRGIPKIKGMRKNLIYNGRIINPSEDQVIDYARQLMSRNDMYGTNSGKDPEDYEIRIVGDRG